MTAGSDFPTRVFVWDRCFLFCPRDYVLDRGARPYKRLSATVMVSLDDAFRVQTGRGAWNAFEGVLIAPNMPREGLDAKGCRLMLFDAGCTTEAFARLHPHLPAEGMRALTADELERCRETIARLDRDDLDCRGARRLLDAVLGHFSDGAAEARALDARILRAIEVVESRAFDEVSVKGIAAEVGVSESRLRALFRTEMGCALSHFIRWANTWKAIRIWQGKTSFTEAAHAAGFYDLAHLDRTLTGSFGISARAITRDSGRFHFCMGDPER